MERIDQLIFEEGAGQKIKEKRNDGLKIMGFHLKLTDILQLDPLLFENVQPLVIPLEGLCDGMTKVVTCAGYNQLVKAVIAAINQVII